MRRTVRSLSIPVACLVFLLSGSIAPAADGGLDGRISLDFEDLRLQRVFHFYEELLNVELDIDPAIDGTITLSFDNITVRTSLNAICESAGCRWELLDGDPGLLRIEPIGRAADLGRKSRDGELSRISLLPADSRTDAPEEDSYTLDSAIALELTDADAVMAFKVVAKIIGAKLLTDVDLKGETITVNASGMPVSWFLDTTCAELGCAWELTDGDPPILGVHEP